MKFVPHQSGKHQSATHDTAKDHVVNQIQKNYKNGNDTATAMREDNCTLSGSTKPQRIQTDADNCFDKDKSGGQDTATEKNKVKMLWTKRATTWSARKL